jgi:hypothetical protein
MKMYKTWKTVYMLKMYIISVIHCVLSQLRATVLAKQTAVSLEPSQ